MSPANRKNRDDLYIFFSNFHHLSYLIEVTKIPSIMLKKAAEGRHSYGVSHLQGKASNLALYYSVLLCFRYILYEACEFSVK